MPEVIVREIHEHVGERVTKAERAHSKFRREGSITDIAEGLPTVVPEVDWNEVRNRVAATITRFFEHDGVDVLPLDGDDTASVFDDYFAGNAPFGAGKKKSEFPDSFAVKSLLRYAAAAGCRIAIVSEDGDWQTACASHDELVACGSLDQVVEHSRVALVAVLDEARTLLEPHRAELERSVLASFSNRGFYWDSSEGHDSEVEETYDEEVESWPWSVLDVDDGWALITGEAEISFRATATYPDPNSCYRDSDTKELIYFGTERATLLAKTSCQVSCRVNVDELRAGRLEVDNLNLDLGDVWFSEEEVEATHDDRDRHR